MLKNLDKCTVFSLLLFTAVFLFWWLIKPEGLYYQEIYQLFNTDFSYFVELVSIPGGLTDYLSEFLVQFYHLPIVGAAILGLLLVGITAATYRTGCCFSHGNTEFNLLHTLPAMLLWYIMNDLNIMHSTLLAILFSILISWHCVAALRSNLTWWKWLSMAMIPLGYFLLGPAICIALIITFAYCIKNKAGIQYPAAALLSTILVMAISIHYVMYPVERFLYGIGYFRYHDFNAGIMGSILLAAACPIINLRLPDKEWIPAAQLAACVIMAALIIKAYNTNLYKALEYLKLAHECKWKEIVADAEKTKPNNPNTLILVNTALAFENKLLDQMFKYGQTDIDCLTPDCKHDMFTPLLSAEALFWMGLNDYAIHHYFESKTGNPTYRESSFCLMRLAECHIVNQDYQVALKYLYRLKKSIFHKKLANEYIALIESGKTESFEMINKLRALKLKNNRIQAKSNLIYSFQDLLKENPSNYMAFEYLMGSLMLEGDFMGIANNLKLGKELKFKGQLPLHLQEAIISLYFIKNGNTDNVTSQVSNEVKTRYQMKNFGPGSLWYYLNNRKNKDK